MGDTTRKIEDAPDGEVLFEAEVPESFGAECDAATARVVVARQRGNKAGISVCLNDRYYYRPNKGERQCVRLLLERIAALEAALAGAVPVEVAREAAGWAHALHHGVAPLTREYVLGLMLNDALFRTEVDRCLARALAEHAANAAQPTSNPCQLDAADTALGKGDSADA